MEWIAQEKGKMMAKTDFKALAPQVLEAVGGKENVVSLTHCVTRLRFKLADESLADDAAIQAMPGVAGVNHVANQYQVIIGVGVDEAYDEVVRLVGDKAAGGEVPEDDAAFDWSPKAIGNLVLDYLSGSLTPLIPMLIASAMLKAILALFGPDMLKLMSAESDLFKLFTFASDAAFYFFPITVGAFAAKKLDTSMVLGMFIGAILIHPTMISMAEEGASFTVYGIPAGVQNYTSTIFPILLSCVALKYVDRFFNRIMPESLKFVFAPLCTTLVMLPLALCVFGPIGGFIGQGLFAVINGIGSLGGIAYIFALALLGALWEYVVMAGMHWMFITAAITAISAGGVDSVLSPAAAPAGFAVGGMVLGAFFLQKTAEERSLSISYLIAQVIGGVVEPGIYGVGFRYKRPFLGMMVGGFLGALYCGITGTVAYSMVPVSSVLAVFGFLGGPTSNFVNIIIACVIAFVSAAAATYFIGLEPKTKRNA